MQITHITDSIIEIRLTEEEEYVEEMRKNADSDDSILKYEELAGEIRMFIELAEEPDSDSSFLDKLRYIH